MKEFGKWWEENEMAPWNEYKSLCRTTWKAAMMFGGLVVLGGSIVTLLCGNLRDAK